MRSRRCRHEWVEATRHGGGAGLTLPAARAAAVPELLYTGTAQSSGVFLEKTPPFTELKRAHELWNRSGRVRVQNRFNLIHYDSSRSGRKGCMLILPEE
jgi:hypothetical protein